MSWIHFYIDEYRMCFNKTESSDEVLSVEHGLDRAEKRPNTWESSSAHVEYVEDKGDKEVTNVCISSDEAESDSVEGSDSTIAEHGEEFDVEDKDVRNEKEYMKKEKREGFSERKVKNKHIKKDEDKRDEWWKSQLEEPYECSIF